MEYLIFMILSTINFPNYNHLEKESICPTCNYHGVVSFANYDSASNIYYFTSVQLGEFVYSLDITKCHIKKDKLKINGIVISSELTKKGYVPLSQVQLLYAEKKDNQLIIKTVLSETNQKGYFKSTVNISEDHYIIIKQSNNLGIVYRVNDFW